MKMIIKMSLGLLYYLKDSKTDGLSKWFVEKFCSCDILCQFSALQGIPCQSYWEKLTNDDTYINKQDRPYIHQAMRVSKIMS